jgi:hypothetical protein
VAGGEADVVVGVPLPVVADALQVCGGVLEPVFCGGDFPAWQQGMYRDAGAGVEQGRIAEWFGVEFR